MTGTQSHNVNVLANMYGFNKVINIKHVVGLAALLSAAFDCFCWQDNEPPFTQFVIRHLSFDDRPILSLALGDPTQCPPAQAQMIKTTPMVHVYLLMNKL